MNKYFRTLNLIAFAFLILVIATGVWIIYRTIVVVGLDISGLLFGIFCGLMTICTGVISLIGSILNIQDGGWFYKRHYETFTDSDFIKLREEFWKQAKKS